MRAYEFIFEAEIKPYEYENLDVGSAVKLLNKHCKESLALIFKPIWRSMRNHKEPIVQIDPSTGIRKSQNTFNYYTEIMDHSPDYAGWPKRSQSLICTLDKGYAEDYGGTEYAIFPYNGVKIGVCPKVDIWGTEITVPELGLEYSHKNYKDMRDLNRFLHYTLHLPETYGAMLRYVKTPEFATTFNYCFANARAKPSQFMDLLQKALSPARAGFKLLSIAELANSGLDENEVWVGGPVVALREDMYQKFLKEIMKGQQQ